MGDVRAAAALLEPLLSNAHVLADAAYDSNRLRQFLSERGSTPVIKLNKTRKHLPPFDADIYRKRNLIERAFSYLKDWRRIATRYDKLARNFDATIALAALLIWWC
jgi:transposase